MLKDKWGSLFKFSGIVGMVTWFISWAYSGFPSIGIVSHTTIFICWAFLSAVLYGGLLAWKSVFGDFKAASGKGKIIMIVLLILIVLYQLPNIIADIF